MLGWARWGLGLMIGMGAAKAAAAPGFYFGVDLSSVNAREACGARFAQDVFPAMRQLGANLVRVRLWVDPSGWTDFGNLADAKRTIARAKAAGMRVLLDFHYSDRWADASAQVIPDHWRSSPDLAKTLYEYTALTLRDLDQAGLTPDIVQVGNETNSELLMDAPWQKGRAIDWKRNARLFDAAIQAVHDTNKNTLVMLHLAQPENVEPWLEAAANAGVSGFDLLGISYYTKWSALNLDQLGAVISRIHYRYGVGVMVAETAYPASLDANGFPYPDRDRGETKTAAQTLLPGFPATPAGQNAFMRALTQTVKSHGGEGVIYWEPARVDVSCLGRARSDGEDGWQNASFYDRHDHLYPGIDYMRAAYREQVSIDVALAYKGSEIPYLNGDFMGSAGIAVPMTKAADGLWHEEITLPPDGDFRLQAYAGLQNPQPLLANAGADGLVEFHNGKAGQRLNLKAN